MDKLIHIKISGSGTTTEVIEALRTLANDIAGTPADNLGTSHTNYEDNTIIATILDLTE